MNDNASVFRDVHFLPWPAHASFPSPADDYHERPLDLKELVVPHPVTTYFMQVEGYSQDVIVVDCAITATHNKIIVARLGEDFTVKRLQVIKGGRRIFLKPENPKYQLLEVTSREDFEL